MVNIQITKDIRSYQPKFIGPFTFRQAVCLCIAVAINIAGIVFQTNVLGLSQDDVNFIPQIILSVIPMFFGWGEDALKMKPETYLRRVLRNMLVIPKNRPYRTRNFYDIYLSEEKLQEHTEEPVNKKQTKSAKSAKKKNEELPPEFRMYE